MISGLASGIAVVGVVVKWLVTSPEREAAAYQKGLTDEQLRCKEDIEQLREQMFERDVQITKFRNALLKLALASDLSMQQRQDIALTLGFPEITQIIVDPHSVRGTDESDRKSQ